MDMIPSHFKLSFPSEADSSAVVRAGRARFTVLASRLIRMEWSPLNIFEERASQAFWFRKQPVPKYSAQEVDGRLVIETEHLRLTYLPDAPYSEENLTIEVKSLGTTWRMGDKDPANLGGTARTLDEVNGATPISLGLISRSGWAVVDDSNSLVFNDVGWLEPRSQPEGQLDLYFIGYGHAYHDCLRDFNRISGAVPMIPRFVLGNWWSRYWEYSQQELTDLMLDFEKHEVPLSVCIIDMDWHITKTGNESSGWTGYTWNRELFPDPDGFIRFLHDQGLKTAMNLHPALGVWPHEEAYEAMCEAIGQDPTKGEPVEFDITNPVFVDAYFRILHHPEEKRGVDFWWMDWQQGARTRLSGLDPLWWLNHLHFLDLGRDGNRRSFIFSRWGGLGNHRYPIGFSGDSVISWESLAFQPYFTATSSNVNYGWWSHDIGGHFGGMEDPEMYARWVQMGVFQPVMRLHSTKNAFHERRPWGFDAETFVAARDVMQLRHMLIPYLYSMAWRYHTDSIPPVLPMYYDHPEREEAYACPNQYLFGDQLLVAPFITPRDPDTRLSRAAAWLPDGEWFDFFSGQHYAGDSWNAVYGTLRDVPVFARAGAIVPLGPRVGKGGVETPAALTVNVFPGADGSFALYEDEGNSMDYLKGAHAITPMKQAWVGDSTTITIGPAEGDTSLLPAARTVDVLLRGFSPNAQVMVEQDGVRIDGTPVYREEARALAITGLTLTPTSQITITVTGANLIRVDDARQATLLKMLRHFRMESWSKQGLLQILPDVLHNPALLGKFAPVMTESQLRALMETITGAGMDYTDAHGEPLIVLWNNHTNRNVTHLYALNRLHGLWRYPEPRPQVTGPLPRFQAIRPKEDIGEGNPYTLQVTYYGIPVTKIAEKHRP